MLVPGGQLVLCLLALLSLCLQRQSWTHLIGQSLVDDKCFLQDEQYALERSDETEETKPFARVQGQGRTGGLIRGRTYRAVQFSGSTSVSR